MSWFQWLLVISAIAYLAIGFRFGRGSVSEDREEAAQEGRSYGFWRGAVMFVGFFLGWGLLFLLMAVQNAWQDIKPRRESPPDADDLA